MMSPYDIFLHKVRHQNKKQIAKSVLPGTLWLKKAAQSQCQKLGTNIFKWKKYYFLEKHKNSNTYRAVFQH